jgi:hypothetical protein
MIVDADGEQLTLRTDDGTSLVFDVPSQQYVSVASITALTQRPAGGGMVVDNSDVPFTLPGFSAVNNWSGDNGGGQITVYAGANGGSKKELEVGQGMLAIVDSQGQSIATNAPEVYYPPSKAYGAWQILDEKGDFIDLVDWAGDEFIFDLAARQFVERWETKASFLDAPLYDDSMPTSDATPQPVVPFVVTPSVFVNAPSTPAAPTAYP